jgi:hypothetical protein
MTRRRLLEIGIALAILVLLIAVFLVRPTSRRTDPPPAPLFHTVEGPLPDFAAPDDVRRIAVPSPDRTRIAMLYPVEFEEPADLYVLTTTGTGVHYTLAESVAVSLTPKNVGWIDPRALWVILGYRYGTVSPGGDLHLVDPETGRGRIVWVSPDSGRTQAMAAEATPDGRWISVRFKVFDAGMLSARDSLANLPMMSPPRGEPIAAR